MPTLPVIRPFPNNDNARKCHTNRGHGNSVRAVMKASIYPSAQKIAVLLAFILSPNTFSRAAPPTQIYSHTYPVEHLAAPTIAGKVQDMVRSAGFTAEIVVDRTNNQIVARGGDEAQKVIHQALAALDVPVKENPTSASTLQPLALPPLKLESVGTALQLKHAADSRIKIATDKRTGQLLILAPESQQTSLRNEALELANPPGQVRPVGGSTPTSGTPVSYRLQNISWQQLETHIAELSGGRPVITTRRNGEVAVFQMTTLQPGDTQFELDRRDGMVTVTSPAPAVAGWMKLLQSFDAPSTGVGQITNFLRLDQAEPEPIQKALRLMAQLPTNATGARQLPPRGLPSTSVALLGPLQQAPTDAPAGTNQTQPGRPPGNLPAANGAGTKPSEAVVEAGSGVLGDVDVQFIEELGVLVIKGSKRDVQRVRDVIKQIEQQSEVTRPEIIVYPLQHINAAAAAELVRTLYDSVLAPRQGQVSVTSLDSPNALLLVGRMEAVEAVKDLLTKLDQPALPSAEMKIYRLKYAAAIDAEATVRNFFKANPGDDEALRPGLGSRARIVADYRTNSLIVQAAPRDLLQVTELVKSLDVDTIPASNQIQVFNLKNTLAEELVLVLQAAITAAEDGDEGRSIPNSRLSILSVDKDGNKVIDSGILTGVVMTADANANAVVVRAPASTMALIAELITQLDRLPGGISTVKVFTIQNGDASALVATLQQLFSLASTTSTGTTTATGAAGPGIGPTQLSGPAEVSVVPLRLAVDRRTNSIIATGSKEDLGVVEALLVRLDTEGLATRITEVIWLRHATSTNVVQALQDFVTNQQSQTIRSTTTPGLGQSSGIIELLDRDLIVADEPITNSLIISVAPRVYDSIRRIIDQLDRRPPMVLVKTLLAEVTLGDGFEFGSELGIQDSLLFDRSTVGASSALTPGFNFNNSAALGNALNNGGTTNLNSVATRGDLGGQALSNFLVGRNSSTFGYGGFVLSAASDSINLLIRALQDANRAQILSRPQIMTLDNTEGSVFVGAQVPRITGFTVSSLGVSQPTVTDTPVGLILRIRPRVGADGLIILEIDAQRSALDLTTQVTIGFSQTGAAITSPQILKTQAASTVTAYDGQTVVYGGLITKNRTQFSRRVPYLSSIPLLGMLFRFDQEREIRTELLVIMTPMIVTSDQDLDYVKATESSRMSWCLSDLVEMHGPAGLSPGYGLWGPAVGSTIYPDLQPTVDDLPPELRQEPLQMHDPEHYVPDEPIRRGPFLEAPADIPVQVSPPESMRRFEENSKNPNDQPGRGARPEEVSPPKLPGMIDDMPLDSGNKGAIMIQPKLIQPANYTTAPSGSTNPRPAARVGQVIRLPVTN